MNSRKTACSYKHTHVHTYVGFLGFRVVILCCGAQLQFPLKRKIKYTNGTILINPFQVPFFFFADVKLGKACRVIYSDHRRNPLETDGN